MERSRIIFTPSMVAGKAIEEDMLSTTGIILIIQIIILLVCAGVLWALIRRFPYPSPLILPFLPPKKRWPETQVRKWIESGSINEGFFAYFSRDPERVVPTGQLLVAPADGKINDIFVRGDRAYIVTALSFWDVHVQRSPVEGKVIEIQRAGDAYMDKEWRDAAFLRQKHCPVQAIIRIQASIGEVEVRLITSLAARRINVWVEVGETISKGQRIGNITLGSTVVAAIPRTLSIKPVTGDRVVAGETILADDDSG